MQINNGTENSKGNIQNMEEENRVEDNIIFLLTPKESSSFLYNYYTLRQGLEKMKFHGYTAMPVITKDGSYAGTVSEGDFLWHILDKGVYDMKKQEDYFITDIIRNDWNPAVKISATLNEVLLRVMNQNFIPVVDDREKFIGIITRKDIIKHCCK